MQASLDRILRGAVERGELVGASASIITPDGEAIAAAGNRAESEPFTEDTLMRLASMTKLVTSVAALRLVERGTLSLDAPAGELVPYLGEVRVLTGFEESGTPLLRDPACPVTLRHLLTHTAGFAYDFANAMLSRYIAATGLPSAGGGLRAAHELPLLFDPGSQWCYGINLDWVGQMIEASTGVPVEAFLRAEILEPLQMHDTVFRRTHDQERRTAGVFQRTPTGLVPTVLELPDVPEFPNAGGGLYGTAADYQHFLRMLLGFGEWHGVRILARQTVELLASNQTEGLPIAGWQTQDPRMSNDVALHPWCGKGWGLGALVTAEAFPNGRSAGALSWGGIANTYYWLDLAAGMAGAFYTQVLPFFDEPCLRVFDEIEQLAYSPR